MIVEVSGGYKDYVSPMLLVLSPDSKMVRQIGWKLTNLWNLGVGVVGGAQKNNTGTNKNDGF